MATETTPLKIRMSHSQTWIQVETIRDSTPEPNPGRSPHGGCAELPVDEIEQKFVDGFVLSLRTFHDDLEHFFGNIFNCHVCHTPESIIWSGFAGSIHGFIRLFVLVPHRV